MLQYIVLRNVKWQLQYQTSLIASDPIHPSLKNAFFQIEVQISFFFFPHESSHYS